MTFRFLIAWAVLFASPQTRAPAGLPLRASLRGGGCQRPDPIFSPGKIPRCEYTLPPMWDHHFRRPHVRRPPALAALAVAPDRGRFLCRLCHRAHWNRSHLPVGRRKPELNPLGDLLGLGAALCWGATMEVSEFASSSGLNPAPVHPQGLFGPLRPFSRSFPSSIRLLPYPAF